MKQFIYGAIIFIFLALPPVRELAESIMAIHMHMQMPLIAAAGLLMTPLLQQLFPNFFAKWNKDGVPGILLFIIVGTYWLIPRTMDDVLLNGWMEFFKFFSWAFLIGVPLRDSWPKLRVWIRNVVLGYISAAYFLMAFVYILAEDQLCNNYLIVDQRTLGWSFLLIALCIVLYLVQLLFIREDHFAEIDEKAASFE